MRSTGVRMITIFAAKQRPVKCSLEFYISKSDKYQHATAQLLNSKLLKSKDLGADEYLHGTASVKMEMDRNYTTSQ